MTFAAYIISYADADAKKKAARFTIHNAQLDEWLIHTTIPITVISMGYKPADYRSDARITYQDIEPCKTAEARHHAFSLFYSSEHPWGIVMDNDAMLYHAVQHNSGYRLIKEMSSQINRYDDLGLLVPINPSKSPFTKMLADDLHQANHVFKRHMDVKGSMIFVRNFRLYGQTEVYPDRSYDWCEDGKLAMDAVKAGHRVMRCENIVLKEKGASSSSFGNATVDRKPFMRAANERMVRELGGPLKMSSKSPHLLDRKEWLSHNWRGITALTVPKPTLPTSLNACNTLSGIDAGKK